MDTSFSLPLFCENNYLAPLGSFRYHGNEGNFKMSIRWPHFSDDNAVVRAK